MGSRLQTPQLIYTQKAWNLTLLILYSEVLEYLSYKNKQRTPTPEYECHQTELSRRMLCRRDCHIPKGVYCLLVSDRMKFSRFQSTKTSANKRFYKYVCLAINRFILINDIFLLIALRLQNYIKFSNYTTLE